MGEVNCSRHHEYVIAKVAGSIPIASVKSYLKAIEYSFGKKHYIKNSKLSWLALFTFFKNADFSL